MAEDFLSLKQLGITDSNKPYFAYPAAVERHILTDPITRARPHQNPPGIDLLAGIIPNSRNAGLILSGQDHFVAFDHTAAAVERHRIEIMPGSKADVSKEGQIRHEGLIIVETDDWRLKIAAFVINVVHQPWLAQRMREEHRMGRVMGDIAVVAAHVLELPEYEIKDIDNQSGVIVASVRHRIF